LAAHTRSNSLPRTGNPAAIASAVFGLVAVLSMPAAYVLQYYSDAVTLLQSTSAAGIAIVFGAYAILLARRARWTLARTIGRSGGGGTARVGRLLGWLGLCLGTSVALAVGFYGLLTLFAKS
jgi:hypothetical protein